MQKQVKWFSSSGQRPLSPWKWSCTVIAFFLALPQASVSTLELLGLETSALGWLPAWARLAGVAVAASIAVAPWILSILTAWRLRREDAPAKTEGRHVRNPHRAEHHRVLMTKHLKMLRMTAHELASRANLTWAEAIFLITNPQIVPDPPVERAIRRALMVPEDWPANGYGEECTKARLLWYSARGGVTFFTAVEIEKADPAIRAAVLDSLERALWSALCDAEGEGNDSLRM